MLVPGGPTVSLTDAANAQRMSQDMKAKAELGVLPPMLKITKQQADQYNGFYNTVLGDTAAVNKPRGGMGLAALFADITKRNEFSEVYGATEPKAGDSEQDALTKADYRKGYTDSLRNKTSAERLVKRLKIEPGTSTSFTDPRSGDTKDVAVDDKGNITVKTTHADGSGTTVGVKSKAAPDEAEVTTTVSDANGQITDTLEKTSAGIRRADSRGHQTAYKFDKGGNLQRSTSGPARTTHVHTVQEEVYQPGMGSILETPPQATNSPPPA